MVEDLGVVPLVGEGHGVHINAALHVPELQRIGLVFQIGLDAHEVHEAAQARNAVHQHFREAGEAAHGVDEGAGVEAEGDEVLIAHVAVHDEPPAHGDDHHGHDAGEKLHGAHKPGHGSVPLLLGGLEALVGPQELLVFRVLVGKGLGGAHAGDAGLNVGVDAGDILLDMLGRLHHLLPVEVHHHQEGGHQQQHHQSQTPLDGEHDGDSADQGHAGDKQVLGAVVGQLRNVEELRRHPAHQVAGAVFVIKAEGEGLQVAKQVPADVRLHQDAEGVAPVADHVLQPRPQQVGGDQHQYHGEERLVLVLGNQLVHADPGHVGEGQIHRRDHQGAGHVQQKQVHMGFEIAEENAQQPLLVEITGIHGSSSVFLESAPAATPPPAARTDPYTSNFLLYHI